MQQVFALPSKPPPELWTRGELLLPVPYTHSADPAGPRPSAADPADQVTAGLITLAEVAAIHAAYAVDLRMGWQFTPTDIELAYLAARSSLTATQIGGPCKQVLKVAAKQGTLLLEPAYRQLALAQTPPPQINCAAHKTLADRCAAGRAKLRRTPRFQRRRRGDGSAARRSAGS